MAKLILAQRSSGRLVSRFANYKCTWGSLPIVTTIQDSFQIENIRSLLNVQHPKHNEAVHLRLQRQIISDLFFRQLPERWLVAAGALYFPSFELCVAWYRDHADLDRLLRHLSFKTLLQRE